MVEFAVETILLYAVLGAVFAVAFALRGAATVDPVARHASAGFRLLVMPGAALLWPVLLVRWWRAAQSGPVVPGEQTDRWQGGSERLRRTALFAWIALAPLIAILLLVALRARAEGTQPSRDAARIPATGEGRR